MFPVRFALTFALLLTGCTTLAAASDTEKSPPESGKQRGEAFSRPYIPVYTADGITQSCELAIKQAQRSADRIAETPLEQASVA
ncbi:MAG: hypothetical protein ACPHER_04690, partial [Nevskiales bacterium]